VGIGPIALLGPLQKICYSNISKNQTFLVYLLGWYRLNSFKQI
jgi:hypothetical protein